MCQCMICGCVWWNYCGVCCAGIHEACCIASYWCFKPDDLRYIDPLCCHVCDCDGYGGNCLWSGMICCAPKAVVEWSGLMQAGKRASDLNQQQTIVINNTSPVYMTHEMSSMNSNPNMGGQYGGMNPGYGGNPNMGGSPGMNPAMGGSPQMQMQGNPNMGMNAGPQGNNAKINF